MVDRFADKADWVRELLKSPKCQAGRLQETTYIQALADKALSSMGESIFPCQEDIQKLALIQPIVHQVQSMIEGVLSEEQQLRLMVLVLSARVAKLESQLVAASGPAKIIYIPGIDAEDQ